MRQALSGLIFIFLSFGWAQAAENIHCTVTQNLQDLGTMTLLLPGDGQKSGIADVGGFEVSIYGIESGLYELEIYDRRLPARNYAKGFLQEKGDLLEITVWQRSVLLSTVCMLH